MTALARAAQLLERRLVEFEARVCEGEEDTWPIYIATAVALAAVAAQSVPGSRGELLTTKQLAERLGISPKTLLKRKARGEVRPAMQLGRRGRAAIRWRGDEVAR
jgi:hypothetical protein